jgi:membrane-associated phospholipid phosphatase
MKNVYLTNKKNTSILKNILEIGISFFSYRYVPQYIVMALGTIYIVTSGLDFQFLLWAREHTSFVLLLVADTLGYLLVISFLLYLWLTKKKIKSFAQKRFEAAYLYAIAVSLFISSLIKTFTGRESPPHHGNPATWIDTSAHFNFGFMNESILGGYPSSHTTVFFALAFVTLYLFPKSKYTKGIQVFSFVVATFIGLGVTLGFHWFSEFFVGVLLGFVVAKIIASKLH